MDDHDYLTFSSLGYLYEFKVAVITYIYIRCGVLKHLGVRRSHVYLIIYAATEENRHAIKKWQSVDSSTF